MKEQYIKNFSKMRTLTATFSIGNILYQWTPPQFFIDLGCDFLPPSDTLKLSTQAFCPTAYKVISHREPAVMPGNSNKSINELPDEILLKVFDFLGVKDKENVMGVSRRWRNFASDWCLWKRIDLTDYAQYFGDPKISFPDKSIKLQEILQRGTSKKGSHVTHLELPGHVFQVGAALDNLLKPLDALTSLSLSGQYMRLPRLHKVLALPSLRHLDLTGVCDIEDEAPICLPVSDLLGLQHNKPKLTNATLPLYLGNTEEGYQSFANSIKKQNLNLTQLTVTNDPDISLANALRARTIFEAEGIQLTFTHCRTIFEGLVAKIQNYTLTAIDLAVCAPAMYSFSNDQGPYLLMFALQQYSGPPEGLAMIRQLLDVYLTHYQEGLFQVSSNGENLLMDALFRCSGTPEGREIIQKILVVYLDQEGLKGLFQVNKWGEDLLMFALRHCSGTPEGRAIINRLLDVYSVHNRERLFHVDDTDRNHLIWALMRCSGTTEGVSIIDRLLDVYLDRNLEGLFQVTDDGFNPLKIARLNCSDSPEGKEIIRRIKRATRRWSNCCTIQ